MFNSFSAGIDFRRLKLVPALKKKLKIAAVESNALESHDNVLKGIFI